MMYIRRSWSSYTTHKGQTRQGTDEEGWAGKEKTGQARDMREERGGCVDPVHDLFCCECGLFKSTAHGTDDDIVVIRQVSDGLHVNTERLTIELVGVRDGEHGHVETTELSPVVLSHRTEADREIVRGRGRGGCGGGGGGNIRLAAIRSGR
jgi:hypothetical protein